MKMTEQRWERIGAATGAGFAVLAVIAYAIANRLPAVDATITEKVGYFVGQRTELLWQTYIFCGSAMMYLWFAGSLRHTLWKAEGDTGRLANVAYGAALTTLAVAMVSQALVATLAYNLAAVPGAGGATATLVLYSIARIAVTLMLFPAAVLIGATSIVVIRHRALPMAVAVAGIPLAVAMVAAGGAFRSSGAAAPGGVLVQMMFLGLLTWTLGTSVAMVAQIGTATEPRTIYLDQPQRERLTEMHETTAG